MHKTVLCREFHVSQYMGGTRIVVLELAVWAPSARYHGMM